MSINYNVSVRLEPLSPKVIPILAGSAQKSTNLTFRSETILDGIVEQINLLGIDEFPDEWVEDIWDAQFTECTGMDLAPHEVLLNALAKISASAKDWLELTDVNRSQNRSATANESFATSTNSELFWKTIIEKGVKYKSLIAMIYYLMQTGQQLNANANERNLCLKASSVYFILLGVPGSGAFNIFHPVLFNKALDTFKLALKLHLAKLSPRKKKKAARGSQKPARPRARQLSRASSTSSGMSQFDLPDSDDSDNDEGGFTSEFEILDLTKGLNDVLFDFLTFLKYFSLKRSFESMEATIQQLVDLTQLETQIPNLDFNQKIRRSGLSALAFNAYVGLRSLCTPLHGPIDKSLQMVMRCLLPGILMNPARGASDLTPRGLFVIREHSKYFVKHLIALIGEASYEAVEILVQHLAVRVIDRSETRLRASESIFDIMAGLPKALHERLLRWFLCLAHNDKPAHRLFSIEVMGRILTKTESSKPVVEDSDDDVQLVDLGEHDYLAQPGPSNQGGPVRQRHASGLSHGMYRFLFGVIYSRCRDSAASVRAKSLQTLADITTVQEIVKIMFKTENKVVRPNYHFSDGATLGELGIVIDDDDDDIPAQEQQQLNPPKIRRRIFDTSDFVKLLENKNSNLDDVDPVPTKEDFVDFLRRRALDESVYVRKNALQVLENILKYATDLFDSTDLIGILSEHCRDPSLMVRKQIVCSLTDLLKAYPQNDEIVEKWVEGIFPLILDVEQKASEKVLESIWDCLFGNLVKHSRSGDTSHDLPWRILREVERQRMTRYLSKACESWAKDKLLKPTIIVRIRSYLENDPANRDSAWLLLALVSGHLEFEDPKFVIDYFNQSIHRVEGVSLYILLQVLRVLFASVSHLPADQQMSLQKDLVLLVSRFAIPPELISTAVDICTVVSYMQSSKNGQADASLKQYHASLDGWAVEIIEMIDTELTQKILHPQLGSDAESNRMHCQIFTLGELAQICPHRINNRLFLLMQSIIFQQGKKHRRRKKDKHAEPVIPSSQTQTTQPPECAFTPTTRLQALSVITLTKMCLQNEEMAKKIVPAFGRLLATNTEEVAIKNNIMYGLSDMGVRYANVVEPILPQMTACLKDQSVTVRRTTLTTLIHLLQEDYLKMSGLLFFRFLQTLTDSEEEIRHMTTFYIQQRLIKKNPKIMYAHFVESLFHYNEYTGHKSYNKNKVPDKERRIFSLKGGDPNKRNSRMKLYKFMLEQMTDEHRILSTNKLCIDILNGCVEDKVVLGEPGSYDLVRDALSCLSCEEIKLASLKTRQDENETENDPNEGGMGQNEMVGVVTAAIKKTIISSVVKKNVIENIVPIVIALKRKLESVKSPLINDLMNYLRELMKDYKNEVKEMLSADKTTATEIQFDLRRWEEDEQQRIRTQREEEGYGGDSPVPSSDDQLRKVLETALETARAGMRKKREKKNRNDEDHHSDSDEELKALQRDPLQSFLIKNLADEEQIETGNDANNKTPNEKLTTMLSPRVVLHNIGTSGKKSRRHRKLEDDFNLLDQDNDRSGKEEAVDVDSDAFTPVDNDDDEFADNDTNEKQENKLDEGPEHVQPVSPSQEVIHPNEDEQSQGSIHPNEDQQSQAGIHPNEGQQSQAGIHPNENEQSQVEIDTDEDQQSQVEIDTDEDKQSQGIIDPNEDDPNTAKNDQADEKVASKDEPQNMEVGHRQIEEDETNRLTEGQNEEKVETQSDEGDKRQEEAEGQSDFVVEAEPRKPPRPSVDSDTIKYLNDSEDMSPLVLEDTDLGDSDGQMSDSPMQRGACAYPKRSKATRKLKKTKPEATEESDTSAGQKRNTLEGEAKDDGDDVAMQVESRSEKSARKRKANQDQQTPTKSLQVESRSEKSTRKRKGNEDRQTPTKSDTGISAKKRSRKNTAATIEESPSKKKTESSKPTKILSKKNKTANRDAADTVQKQVVTSPGRGVRKAATKNQNQTDQNKKRSKSKAAQKPEKVVLSVEEDANEAEKLNSKQPTSITATPTTKGRPRKTESTQQTPDQVQSENLEDLGQTPGYLGKRKRKAKEFDDSVWSTPSASKSPSLSRMNSTKSEGGDNKNPRKRAKVSNQDNLELEGISVFEAPTTPPRARKPARSDIGNSREASGSPKSSLLTSALARGGKQIGSPEKTPTRPKANRGDKSQEASSTNTLPKKSAVARGGRKQITSPEKTPTTSSASEGGKLKAAASPRLPKKSGGAASKAEKQNMLLEKMPTNSNAIGDDNFHEASSSPPKKSAAARVGRSQKASSSPITKKPAAKRGGKQIPSPEKMPTHSAAKQNASPEETPQRGAANEGGKSQEASSSSLQKSAAGRGKKSIPSPEKTRKHGAANEGGKSPEASSSSLQKSAAGRGKKPIPSPEKTPKRGAATGGAKSPEATSSSLQKSAAGKGKKLIPSPEKTPKRGSATGEAKCMEASSSSLQKSAAGRGKKQIPSPEKSPKRGAATGSLEASSSSLQKSAAGRGKKQIPSPEKTPKRGAATGGAKCLEASSSSLQKSVAGRGKKLIPSPEKTPKRGATTKGVKSQEASSSSLSIRSPVKTPGLLAAKGSKVTSDDLRSDNSSPEKTTRPIPVINTQKREPRAGPSKSPSIPAPKTPAGVQAKKKQFSNLRAISTPTRNESMMRNNVTFLEQSHELSAIPVLSPPSTTRKKKKKVQDPNESTGSSACSFRFRPNGKDPFDVLVKSKKP